MKRIFLFILLLATVCCNFAYAQEVKPEAAEINYENGKQQVVETFYENGALESKGTYRWGRKNGIFREYYENGQIKSICLYRQDVLLSKENFKNMTSVVKRILKKVVLI